MRNSGVDNLLPHNELGRLFLQKLQLALTEIRKDVIELDDIIEQVFIAMLCDGHAILQGVPGVGKTLLVKAIARTIDARFTRIQFTSDMKPDDLYVSLGGFDIELQKMKLGRGPIYGEFILADEINRGNTRTFGPMVEPFEEKQITFDNKTEQLGPFYFCVATQNPVESVESTIQLPEALQERFALMILVPPASEELMCRIAVHDTRKKDLAAVFSKDDIVGMQHAIYEQYVLCHKYDDSTIRYIAHLIATIRDHEAVLWGPGVRGMEDLTRASAVHAFLHGRDRITFDDVHAIAKPALRFKFSLNRKARAYGITNKDEMIERVLDQLPLAEGG